MLAMPLKPEEVPQVWDKVKPLIDKVKGGSVDEVIFALSVTMEADTTNFYIYKLLSRNNVNQLR